MFKGSETRSQFKHVIPKKVSDFIAEQLEEAIILKEVLPEEQLPPERELCLLFNASRLTVREAIAQLQEKGLIESRRGASGGTFVLPLTANIHEKTKEKIQSEWANFEDLLEYRNMIEPQAIPLAVERITPEQLEYLVYLNEKISTECNREEFRSIDVQFHLQIAAVTNNRYIENAVRMIRTKINPGLDLLPYDEHVRSISYQSHQQLIEALATKDKQRAYQLMSAHIATTTEKLKQLFEK